MQIPCLSHTNTALTGAGIFGALQHVDLAGLAADTKKIKNFDDFFKDDGDDEMEPGEWVSDSEWVTVSDSEWVSEWVSEWASERIYLSLFGWCDFDLSIFDWWEKEGVEVDMEESLEEKEEERVGIEKKINVHFYY